MRQRNAAPRSVSIRMRPVYYPKARGHRFANFDQRFDKFSCAGARFRQPAPAGARSHRPRVREVVLCAAGAGHDGALAIGALTLPALDWQVILEARWTGVLTLTAFTAVALAIGHLLGWVAVEDRTALAIACSTRHLGIAVLVAASVPGPRTAVVVAVYILTATAISIPYLKWRRSDGANAHTSRGCQD